MDVIYSYRDFGYGWDLRYSLRSRAANMGNVGRVIVAGDPPEWLSPEVVKVRCAHPYAERQKNILAAVVAAMCMARVDGPALYSSDDHFIVKPLDADAVPYMSRQGFWGRFPTEADLLASGRQLNPWRMSMVETGRLLRRLGLPDDNWGGHFDTHVDGRDLPRVLEMVGPWDAPFNYEPSSLFIAAARERDPSIRAVPTIDRKLRADVRDMDAFAGETDGFVSVAESRALPGFRKWMEARFPKPCRWEKR